MNAPHTCISARRFSIASEAIVSAGDSLALPFDVGERHLNRLVRELGSLVGPRR
jgi:hypothetical protein